MKRMAAFREALGVLHRAQLSKDGAAFMDAVAELLAERDELGGALKKVLSVIDAGGGPLYLSRGVELGQASWMSKLSRAVERSQQALERAGEVPE